MVLTYSNFKSNKNWFKKNISNELKSLLFRDRKLGLELLYHLNTGKILNFNNISRYSEVIQYIKLNIDQEYIYNFSDKLMVRKYIKNIDLGFILPKIYKVFSKNDDIDISNLPNNSVLKMSSGWNQNIIINQKSKNTNSVKIYKLIEKWKKYQFGIYTGELQYINNKNYIFCEEYLGDKILEVKFYCIYGKALFYEIDSNRYSNHTRNFFSIHNNQLDISFGIKQKQKCNAIDFDTLNLLLDYSERISKQFVHVRVDFNLVNNFIYFSELTFTPSAGYKEFTPLNFDLNFSKIIIRALRKQNEFNQKERKIKVI